MAKKLNVYVAEECDRYYPHQDEDITVFHRRDTAFHPVKATLVISDERVFTESEVITIVRKAIEEVRKAHVVGITNVSLASGSILRAFEAAGIVLDPA